MSSAVQQLQALHQYLDKVYLQHQTLASTGRLHAALSQLASNFAALYRQHPVLLHAQLSLHLPQYSLRTQLAVKQLVLVLALCRNWPAAQQESLLGAAITALCGLSEQQLSAQQQAALADPWLLTLRTLQPHLSPDRLQLFASCCRYLQGQPLWQLDPQALVLVLTYQLALPLTVSKSGFEQSYRRQWSRQQGLGRTLLQRLAAIGPSLYQPGRFCSDHIGVVAFISDAEPALTGYLFDLHLRSLNAEPVSLTGAGLQLLAPKALKEQSWLALLVRRADDDLTTADPEPVSLALLQQLDPNWKISKQISFLQQHAQFSELLQQEASRLSRQQLAVADLRHALALIGTEQLPSLLRLAWLKQQIQQCNQPWQGWFSGLCATFATSLQLLAKHCQQVSLSDQQALLLASCVSLQLQQQDMLRHLPLHSTSRHQMSLPKQCRRQLWLDPELMPQLAQLLASTGLGVLWQDAVLHWRQPVEMMAEYSQQQSADLLLQLAWLLTELFYLGGASKPDKVDSLEKTARHALDLPKVSLNYWLEQLLQQQAFSWPLQPEL